MRDDGSSNESNKQTQYQKEPSKKPSQVLARPTSSDVSMSKPQTVISYPEFPPSPRIVRRFTISFRRFLSIIYLSMGATASLYLISKVDPFVSTINVQLFVYPLIRRIVQARREFYQHSCQKVNAIVSLLSDRLVTFGTAFSGSSEPSSVHEQTVSEKLTQITNTLRSQINTGETEKHSELSLATEDLIVYLNNHLYSSAAFAGYSGLYGGITLDGGSKSELINLVKTEIRSVKGVVLNMRNFPPLAG